jgi:hypothetical protein
MTRGAIGVVRSVSVLAARGAIRVISGVAVGAAGRAV